MLRRLSFLGCLAALAACSRDGASAPLLRLTSISPPPGATDVSRRVVIRCVVQHDVDAASVNTSSCQVAQLGFGPEPADVTFDPATRLLTIAPRRTLARSTTYRVQLSQDLRSTSGAPFLNTIDWDFTTNGDAAWDFSAKIGDGTLLACEPSRRGGVLAVWKTPDTALQFSHFDGAAWSPPVLVGISNVESADVADDTTGRVVVAATIGTVGQVLVTRSLDGAAFSPTEAVGDLALGNVDVDASDSGHIAVGWYGFLSSQLRTFVPGVGWATPYSIWQTGLSVGLQPAGNGRAVGGLDFPSGGSGIAGVPLQITADGLGVWTLNDPLPPQGSSGPWGMWNKAQWREDRVLLALYGHSPPALFERSSSGWERLEPVLAVEPNGTSIAQGNGAFAVAMTVATGSQPVVYTREESTFVSKTLGSSDQPAPTNPSTGVAISSDNRLDVVWTAAVDGSPGAQVRLVATSRLPNGAWPAAVPIDGPFSVVYPTPPVQSLRVIPFGRASAIAVWSRDGAVRCAIVR
jgi:hypothetical protein